MGRFWSIFFNETFRISYWHQVEQIKILRSGIGAISKNHIFSTSHLNGIQAEFLIGGGGRGGNANNVRGEVGEGAGGKGASALRGGGALR